MLISHVFLFDMVCAVLSSFQLQGPWFESIGLAEVDRNSVYDGTRNQMGCILVIASLCCDFRAAAATAAAAAVVAAAVVAAAVVAAAVVSAAVVVVQRNASCKPSMLK